MEISSSNTEDTEINVTENICRQSTMDAEEDETIIDEIDENSTDNITFKKKIKPSRIFDSDENSDDENVENDNESDTSSLHENVNTLKKKKKTFEKIKLSQLSGSDNSDEENTESLKTSLKSICKSIDEENSDSSQENSLRKHEDILRKFAESDSSENESINNDENELKEGSYSNNEDIPSPIPKYRANKVQRRSAKQAEENILSIQSETQKLFRETKVAVPYHRPRQCTLKEFLGRKNIQKPVLNEGRKCKLNINMRGEELLRYAKHLEERAKEAELFFTISEKKTIKENQDVHFDKTNEMADEILNKDQNDKTEDIFNKDCQLNVEVECNNENVIGNISDTNQIVDSLNSNIIEPLTESLNTDQIIEPLTEEDSEEIIDELQIEICKETNNDKDLNVDIAEKNEVLESGPASTTSNKEEEFSGKIESEKNISDSEPTPSTSKQVNEEEFNSDLEPNKNNILDSDPTPSTSKQADEADNIVQQKTLDENAFRKLSDSEDEDDEYLMIDSDKLTKVIEQNSNVSSSIPRLSGSSGMIIDLEENRVVSEGVSQLMQRFMKHSKVKPALKKHIVRGAVEDKADGVLIVNPDEMEANKANLVPGIALQKLRTELRHRMIQRRTEELSKLIKQQEEEKAGYEADILDDEFEDDEEELEMERSSLNNETEIEEDEEEEGFIEDKADETGNKGDDEECVDDANDISEADDEDSENESSDDSDNDADEIFENKNIDTAKKIRKRLQIMDSSDSEDEIDNLQFLKKDESSDFFQTQNEKNLIPLHQTKFAEIQTTPQNKSNNTSKNSELKLLSPSPLLENISTTPNNVQTTSYQLSKINDEEGQPNPTAVKKLFSESLETTQQNNFFVPTQNGINTDIKKTEDELFELCSGGFPTQTPAVQMNQNEINDNEHPQDSMKLFLSDDDSLQNILKSSDDNNVGNEKKVKQKSKHTMFKPLQFSDDEEDSNKENTVEDDNDADENDYEEMDDGVDKLYEYDSEENEIEVIIDKKKQAKIVERETRDFFENEAELSESDWGSADEDEKGLDTYDVELGDADVIDTTKVHGELERIHMRQVLDEDKREVRFLQELLLEDGENHGDAERERKFKWKNAGEGFTLDDKTDDQDQDDQISEDEDQTEWRKNRFEREKVLREKQIELDEITDTSALLSDTLLSETFSAKKTILIRRKAVPNQNVQLEKEESLLGMGSIKMPCRGSFLRRDETTLSRLSALTKTNLDDAENSKGLGSTGKGNFVFTTLSPAQEKLPTEEKTRKRAPTEELNNVNKKVKRISVNKKLLLDYLE